MKHVKRSVLLWYSPREMYDLVIDIERYPSFLPWCAKADVVETPRRRHDGAPDARQGGVRHAFTTRNRHRTGEQVSVALVDGPSPSWKARGISCRFARRAPKRGDAAACRIEFDLRYAFANAALEALVSPVFDRIANTLVDSFVQRAEQVHGAR